MTILSSVLVRAPVGALLIVCSLVRANKEAMDLEREAKRQERTEAAAEKQAKREAAEQRNPWLKRIQRNDEGKPLSIVANAVTVIRNDSRWKNSIGYDEMRERPVWLAPPEWDDDDAGMATKVRGDAIDDVDVTRAQGWLSRRYGLHVSPQIVGEAFNVVALTRPFNAAKEYIDRLKWDGEPRLNSWLAIYCGAEENDYTRAIGSRWMIGAVARVYEPGCKLDNVIVLEGEQGIGKSTIVRRLARRPEWFFDSELQIGDKDAPQALAGKWIVEFGELHALSRAAFTAVKAFVSRQTDTYRPSYGRTSRDFPRRWAAIGTTNADVYLTDQTGNRRWWPVKCGTIDLVAFERDADQLWAEARVRYEQREVWHIDSRKLAALCAAEQAERTQGDPWDEVIGHWLAKPDIRVELAKSGYVTTARVLGDALKIDAGKWTRADEMRAAEALIRLGWAKGVRRRIGGARVHPYIAPLSEVGTGWDGGWDASTAENTRGSSTCPNRPYVDRRAHKEEEACGGYRDTDTDRDRDLYSSSETSDQVGTGWDGGGE